MNTDKYSEDEWLYEIKPKDNFFSLHLSEVWKYRDLLFLFVKRDVVTVYKQTILGPLWYLIQPLFTSIIPAFLYNLAGVVVWNYFTTCLTETSDTFKKNAAIFGKVYFPRLIMPLSVVISNLLKLGIQLFIFISFYIYYLVIGRDLVFNSYVFLFPVFVVLMGILGLGLGMIISSLVTKYRDLSFLIGFGVQLLMYVSAVMYPIALIKEKLPNYGWLVEYNPLAYVIEASRFMLLNEGEVSLFGIIYTIVVTIVVFFIGLLIFNKTEKSFIDTV